MAFVDDWKREVYCSSLDIPQCGLPCLNMLQVSGHRELCFLNVLVIFAFRLKLLPIVRRRNLMPSAAFAQVFFEAI